MKPLETVDRALQLLQAFDRDHRELSVGELAEALQVHHSNASRLAATLALRGFLERATGSERYRVGPELRRLGMLGFLDHDLVSEAREIMNRLVDEVGETVALSTLDGDQAVDIAESPGRHVIGARQWIGRRYPLHATSDGKVFLAFAAPLESSQLEALTEHTITDPDELKNEIDEIRRRGWATARSELETGMCGVAAPVFGPGGQCVAALNITGPDYRLPEPALRELGRTCRAAADDLSARLGFTG
ncbi:IclR family transcriptional regulator [Saccharopolyspora sp. K220]|uniref:IclR family transcriptional regulator n=1 Tax=Saccharopolyspora soli TaxID=2926618 RepID=UPI001F5A9A9A|nr:IclR family transcriptional regulator [Saccharopolyspora soli]MCI2419472.1 IclR family transcriptional regulator [Saccharopolyspora soli]